MWTICKHALQANLYNDTHDFIWHQVQAKAKSAEEVKVKEEYEAIPLVLLRSLAIIREVLTQLLLLESFWANTMYPFTEYVFWFYDLLELIELHWLNVTDNYHAHMLRVTIFKQFIHWDEESYRSGS